MRCSGASICRPRAVIAVNRPYLLRARCHPGQGHMGHREGTQNPKDVTDEEVKGLVDCGELTGVGKECSESDNSQNDD